MVDVCFVPTNPQRGLEREKDHDGAFVRVMARTGHSDLEENWKMEN